MNLKDDNYCFACGKKNPIGLKMNFDFKDNSVTVKFIPKKEHQGWNNIIHGGILFTLMDEALARLLIHKGNMVLTLRLDTRFLRPVKVGEEIAIIGKINKEEGNLFYTQARILNSIGKTMASCKGVYIKQLTVDS